MNLYKITYEDLGDGQTYFTFVSARYDSEAEEKLRFNREAAGKCTVAIIRTSCISY